MESGISTVYIVCIDLPGGGGVQQCSMCHCKD